MHYSIKQAARMTGLSEHTLRYYDKENILPYLERTQSGTRRFSDRDIEWIEFLNCLKKTGMSIENIKQYTDLCQQGDETLAERLEIFKAQRLAIEEKIAELNESLQVVKAKISRYSEAYAAYQENNKT